MLDHNAALQPLVVRSFDAKEANRIINDPAILSKIAPSDIDQIDLTEVIANPRNVLLEVEGGILLFGADIEGGRYELHTTFLPDYGGVHALTVSREAYRWMFTHTECMEIVTRVPAVNRAAALMARKIGFIPQFSRHDVWKTLDGYCDVKFYSLSYETWLGMAKDELIESGRRFHRELDAQRAAMGHGEPHHPDEDCHDHYVGARCETIYSGQPAKAVVLYNRWARWSGYGQIALISQSPLVIDIGDAVLLIQNGDFKILRIK